MDHRVSSSEKTFKEDFHPRMGHYPQSCSDKAGRKPKAIKPPPSIGEVLFKTARHFFPDFFFLDAEFPRPTRPKSHRLQKTASYLGCIAFVSDA